MYEAAQPFQLVVQRRTPAKKSHATQCNSQRRPKNKRTMNNRLPALQIELCPTPGVQ